MVILSAMLEQTPDFHTLTQKAVRLGRRESEKSPGLNMEASPYTWINQGCQLFWGQIT